MLSKLLQLSWSGRYQHTRKRPTANSITPGSTSAQAASSSTKFLACEACTSPSSQALLD